jgi:amidase
MSNRSNLARTFSTAVFSAGVAFLCMAATAQRGSAAEPEFQIIEATIESIHRAIETKQITSTELVDQYLARIKAYDGPCVKQPDGILGFIEPIPNAGKLNALLTLNLRPATRERLGFDRRKARSLTDREDDDPAMPDALEVAADLDRRFAATGKLVGPLHGIVFSIKDQYDTFDMRTTNGMDSDYADDRPPDDATFVKRMRDAGAIILAKANLGDFGTGISRSAFGGVLCNPYDTARSPGSSSGGSGSSVSANLVTCSVAEETGGSILHPSWKNSVVGIAPTQELVSRDGMINMGWNTRVGPICRTVPDAARVLDVIAGYDPKDEFTALSVGQLPSEPYHTFARGTRLDGLRIGVAREYMDKRLFTSADVESIDIVVRALDDLRRLGATIVDPGPEGALFQDAVDKLVPIYRNKLFTDQFEDRFPVEPSGKPATDHIPLLVDMYFDPSLVPDGPTVRGLGATPALGQAKYMINRYLRERGDANIRTLSDLIAKSRFFTDIRPDAGFVDRRALLEEINNARTLDMANIFQTRFATRQIVLQTMAMLRLDAVAFPTGNTPAEILGAPREPTVNGRDISAWGVLGMHGFPTMSVPAGFTTHVYDRVRDATAVGGTRLVGPVAARLPVGLALLGRPFAEPMVLRIASAYEAATKHRMPPSAFGALPSQ